MNRKIINYQVENGKISTIDGYKVGGGEAKKLKLTYNKTFLDLKNFHAGATIEAGKTYLTAPQSMRSNELPMMLGSVSVGSFGTAICAWSIFKDSASGDQYGALTCIVGGKLADGIIPRMSVYKITVDEEPAEPQA